MAAAARAIDDTRHSLERIRQAGPDIGRPALWHGPTESVYRDRPVTSELAVAKDSRSRFKGAVRHLLVAQAMLAAIALLSNEATVARYPGLVPLAECDRLRRDHGTAATTIPACRRATDVVPEPIMSRSPGSPKPRSYQHGLPLPDPEPTEAKERPAPAAESTDHRAIHVSGYAREGRDFYATPHWVTEALLKHVRFRGPIWEPCCGDGAMSAVLEAHGYDVISTDIADRGFGTPGVDFLAAGRMWPGCRAIVTNPPYGDTGSHRGQARSPLAMLDFLAHALALTAAVQGQLALLVRLQWIAGRRAAGLLSRGPFAATIILTRRIQWFDMGQETNQAQHHHAWVVFDHDHPAGSPPALLYA